MPLDREVLARAQQRLGTKTITDTVEQALRLAAGKPHVALGASGKPPVARRLREAMEEEGFGTR